MRVVFIHGPPAAGKHTIASLLSKRMGLPLFHNHLTVDLVKELFAFGEPGFIRLRESIWTTAFEEAAKAGKSFIFTFNPESTVDPALIQRLQSIYERAGGSIAYIELTCADAVILERLDNTSRHQFGKLTDPAMYKHIQSAGGFDFPPLPGPRISIDTGTTKPADAADLIENALLS